MDGRFSVAIDDIRKAADPVLRHRIGTNFQAQAEGKTSEDIIAMLLSRSANRSRQVREEERLTPWSCGIAFCGHAEVRPTSRWTAHVRDLGRRLHGHFRGDDLGWTAAELSWVEATPVYAART